MISYSIRMGPNPMTSVLKDEGNLKTDMGEDIALWRQSRDWSYTTLHQGMPGATRLWKKSEKGSSLEPSEHGSDFLASGTVRK